MKEIKIGGVPEHFNFPWHKAMEQGKFKSKDIKVVWEDFYGGSGQLIKSLANDRIDIGIMLTESAIQAIEQDYPFLILQKFVDTPLMWGIHVAENSTFTNVEQLRGQKAAISRRGSGSHLMAFVHAKQQNWDLEKLTFENVKNLNGALKALPQDQAQYFLWEHFTTKPFVDQKIFRRLGDIPTPWPCFVLVAKEAFILNNKELLESLLNVINQLSADLKEQTNLVDEIAEKYKLDKTDVEKWLNQTEWSQNKLSEAELEEIQKELLALGLINSRSKHQDICVV
ncbi:substrate-binding domain-containing protein [Mesonia sp. HuA40]|uniref:substrate-binding domain-containing protein n=1 Tax=Mesonia sp. HuA40 TaxID=2602761 RepID=UPI0011CB589C|nr:substrate-binding domain-containing protein [Mesonia sp. HuA40]TXK70989.1 ABC transporter substrate-binding protein [Mesonia sp. HuA40]